MKSASVNGSELSLEGLYPDSGCGDFTQSLIELGALICVPKGEPKCGICPAADFCRSRERGTAMELPVRPAKKERKKVIKTVLILSCDGRTAVRKRGKNCLLAGMYEFPNVDEPLNAEQAIAVAEEWGCSPADLLRDGLYPRFQSRGMGNDRILYLLRSRATGLNGSTRGDGRKNSSSFRVFVLCLSGYFRSFSKS